MAPPVCHRLVSPPQGTLQKQRWIEAEMRIDADFVGNEGSIDDHGGSVYVRLGDMGKRRLNNGSQEGDEARDKQS